MTAESARTLADPFGRVWRFSSYDEQNSLMNATRLENVRGLSTQLVDYSIMQRLREGTSGRDGS